MSFSVQILRPAGAWKTEPVPYETVKSADLPDAFMGSTAHNDLIDVFNIDIRNGLNPYELQVVAAAIRDRLAVTHTCNCEFCTWSPPDLGRSSRDEWELRAAYLEAVAAHGWDIEGSY